MVVVIDFFLCTIAMKRLCHRDGSSVSSRWFIRAIAMVHRSFDCVAKVDIDFGTSK
jgi:hypothetical protein